MSVRGTVPGFFSEKGRAALVYYVVPIVAAWILSFLLVTWAFMLVGASVWTVAIAASLLGAVFSVFMEEVVHDVQ